ncbi:MAG: MoaD/ThiS family protein [Thermoplasmatota archaeon]
MKIYVKLTGRYKEIVSKSEFELSMNPNDTIWNVIDKFAARYPEVEKDKKFIMVSKNNVYTTYDEQLADGDIVTLSPPVVSGG